LCYFGNFLFGMTPQEQAFAQRRTHIETLIQECLMCLDIAFDLRPDTHIRLISLDDALRADTLLNQQILISWLYRTPNGEISLDVTIGADGPNWQPFVTVTTSDGQASERFAYSSDSNPARPFIIRQVKRINGIE
jgi:hypothetical protein